MLLLILAPVAVASPLARRGTRGNATVAVASPHDTRDEETAVLLERARVRHQSPHALRGRGPAFQRGAAPDRGIVLGASQSAAAEARQLRAQAGITGAGGGPWGFAACLVPLLACCCAGGFATILTLFLDVTSKTEQQLRRAIDRQSLWLLNRVLPLAREARAAWELMEDDDTESPDPVPSLGEAEMMLPRLMVAQEKLVRAKAEGKASCGAIREAIASKALPALRRALQGARGRLGVDMGLQDDGHRLLFELERDAARQAKLAALRDAAEGPSTVALCIATVSAQDEGVPEANLREAAELLAEREVGFLAELGAAGRHVLPLLHSGVEKGDPDLIECAVQVGTQALPAFEVATARRHAVALRREAATRDARLCELTRHLDRYKSSRTYDAVKVAEALDDCREAGLSQSELQDVLRAWDPQESFHHVKLLREAKVVRIRSKAEVASPGSAHVLLPACRGLTRRVWKDDVAGLRAQAPAVRALHLGLGRSRSTSPVRKSAAAELDVVAVARALAGASKAGKLVTGASWFSA